MTQRAALTVEGGAAAFTPHYSPAARASVSTTAMFGNEGGLINPEHLPWYAESGNRAPALSPAAPDPLAAQPVVEAFPAQGVDLEAMERTLVEGALKQAGQNRSKAAKLLGLSRSKLYSRMERFGLA